jgi:hypothetical protein
MLRQALIGISLRAGEGTRTPDPLFTRQALYQLSYSGAIFGRGYRRGDLAERRPLRGVQRRRGVGRGCGLTRPARSTVGCAFERLAHEDGHVGQLAVAMCSRRPWPLLEMISE